jgi:citrate synthase
MARYLSAEEAARRLGVSRATLYAYVSRGLIRSEASDAKRERNYLAEDVERLLQRREQRRNPAKVVQEALHWGAPVLESSLCLIQDGRLFYRGLDAIELSSHKSFEQVAALLWSGRMEEAEALFGSPFSPPRALSRLKSELAGLSPVEAFQVALPFAAAHDLAAYDLRPAPVAQAASRVLRLLVAVATGKNPQGYPLAEALSRTWTRSSAAAPLLNQALVLCAEHELNVSSFTVRCVASAGATPYAAVLAGLSAFQGSKHGRMVERVEAFLREAEAAGPRQAIAGYLRRGEGVPGFGHKIYPEGDPRGRALLQALGARYKDAPAVTLVRELVAQVRQELGEQPTIDVALAALARVLGLPSGAGMAIYAIGRTAGWIAHALEEYQSGRLIRPRARYTGPGPR